MTIPHRRHTKTVTLSAMSRQSRTLAVGAVLCLVLGVLSFTLRVPVDFTPFFGW